MARFTVLGATGFVGSHLAEYLRSKGEEVFTPDLRQGVPEEPCGNLVYCVGLTGDFRERPFDTMRAHVSVLSEILEGCAYESFLYLSSTRVYAGAESGAEEARLRVEPTVPGDLYNLSKLAGEALCLACPSPVVRVARLSSVFAADADVVRRSPDFLPTIIRAAMDDGRVVLETAPDSMKDYVWIGDAVRALHRIAAAGSHRLYNVASGRAVSHGDIVGALQKITGCTVEVLPGARRTVFPSIDVSRLGSEFAPPDRPWAPAALPDMIEDLAACRGGVSDTVLAGAQA